MHVEMIVSCTKGLIATSKRRLTICTTNQYAEASGSIAGRGAVVLDDLQARAPEFPRKLLRHRLRLLTAEQVLNSDLVCRLSQHRSLFSHVLQVAHCKLDHSVLSRNKVSFGRWRS